MPEESNESHYWRIEERGFKLSGIEWKYDSRRLTFENEPEPCKTNEAGIISAFKYDEDEYNSDEDCTYITCVERTPDNTEEFKSVSIPEIPWGVLRGIDMSNALWKYAVKRMKEYGYEYDISRKFLPYFVKLGYFDPCKEVLWIIEMRGINENGEKFTEIWFPLCSLGGTNG